MQSYIALTITITWHIFASTTVQVGYFHFDLGISASQRSPEIDVSWSSDLPSQFPLTSDPGEAAQTPKNG